MSFARTEGQVTFQNEESGTDNLETEILERQTESEEEASSKMAVFDTDAMTVASNSPFLQPMSSMIMLNAENTRHGNTTDSLSTESDTEKPAFGRDTQTSDITISNVMSPYFPWTQLANNQEGRHKEIKLITNDKNLPSISSILCPIGSQFSELSFPLQGTPPLQNASSRQATSILSLSRSRFSQSSVVQHTRSKLQKVKSEGAMFLSPSSYSSCIGINQGIPSAADIGSSQNQGVGSLNTPNPKNSSKTVFRTILPKPIDKQPDGKFQIGSAKRTEKIARREDVKFELMGANSEYEGAKLWSIGHAPGHHDSLSAASETITSEDMFHARQNSTTATASSSVNLTSKKSARDNVSLAINKPVYNVNTNMYEEDIFDLKGVAPNEVISAKRKKSTSSGNLEVASALLSMGSSDGKDKNNAKVVSSFNREKATFEIKESSNAQHGDILFTATGNFQIEDIEIDPKKNKIEKGSPRDFA